MSNRLRYPAHRRLRNTLTLATLITGALSLPGHAALFEADALNEFAPRAGAGDPFDHGPWQDFLDRYLVTDDPGDIHLVRYADVSAEDRRALDAYLSTLAATDPRSASRDAQMAYWINLYNALTVQLILDAPGVKSIRDLSSGLFSTGPWGRELTRVAGVDLTLNDIEHRILRPLFTDARIHFAVNCASMGCPDLAAEAWTATNLERLLAAGARDYVNHPRGARFDKGRLILSSIFDWYRSDFPDGRAALLDWLASHADADKAQALRSFSGSISHAYDWDLNQAPPAAAD